MKWILENWYILIILGIALLFIICAIMGFAEKETDVKLDAVKEWLKFAVVEAEKKLGSKTGELKLRMVYDMAIEKFPWLSTAISFTYFSIFVDEALEWMKEQLQKNEAINSYVEGKMTNKEFIEKVACYVENNKPAYIKVVSPIIAQVCLESGWGKSDKVRLGQNYAGLKWRENRCPSGIGYFKATGSEQNATTKEYTSSEMLWQKCKNLENCIVCYFEFTSIKAYENLRNVTDPKTYLENIKKDGYATSVDYVDKCMNIINTWDLTKYDKPKYYRVQVGAYSRYENAESTQKALISSGFNCVIKTVNGLYKCQIGAFSTHKNAEVMLSKVNKKGFNAFITYS